MAPKPVHEGKGPIEDILWTYRDALVAKTELVSVGERSLALPGWQHLVVYALVAVLAALIWNRSVGRRRAATPWVGERWLELALVLGLIGLGIDSALERANCFDDAFISLRYADNFVAGKGLVFNEGEYVEGYTNFLWTMLISLVMVLTPAEPPLIAVLASLAAFATNLFVVWRISKKIAPGFHAHAFVFPLAVAILAVQNTFTDYGTTGLETAFASLLVNLGVLALISGTDAKSSFGAGSCWILATLTRPDHALFYVVGAGVVGAIWLAPLWAARKSGWRAMWRAGLRPIASYAAPFAIWLIYMAWKLAYYGELMPNTYYAKSAYLAYYSQGWVYFTAFHVGDHMWIVTLVLVLLWPWWPPSNKPARRFMAFVIPAVVVYEIYVLRTGGDFMYGRFYVTLIPLLILAGEQLVHELAVSRGPGQASEPPTRQPLPLPAIAVAGLLAASATEVRLFSEATGTDIGYISDESAYYPITEWSPMVINHTQYAVGLDLGELRTRLEAEGVEPPILASGSVGLIGYYSGMPLIDRLGLTDASVAHQRLAKRGRPGHEKWAKPSYLHERGVHFRRGGRYPKWFRRYATIDWSRSGGSDWYILRYDPELLAAIREVDPGVRFYDFGIYIDKYIAGLPSKEVERVRSQWAHFRRYYFDHNDDPERRAAFERYFEWTDAGKDPADLAKAGAWDAYIERGRAARRRERQMK